MSGQCRAQVNGDWGPRCSRNAVQDGLCRQHFKLHAENPFMRNYVVSGLDKGQKRGDAS